MTLATRDLAEEHQLWLTNQLKKMGAEHPDSVNPVVKKYGLGPEGKTCQGCKGLYFTQFSKRYYKCRLRKETRGPGSDHRMRWPACAKYDEKETK